MRYDVLWRLLFANDTESVTVTRIEKRSGDVTMPTLSPGERAGVRASVNSHSIENSEELNQGS